MKRDMLRTRRQVLQCEQESDHRIPVRGERRDILYILAWAEVFSDLLHFFVFKQLCVQWPEQPSTLKSDCDVCCARLRCVGPSISEAFSSSRQVHGWISPTVAMNVDCRICPRAIWIRWLLQ